MFTAPIKGYDLLCSIATLFLYRLLSLGSKVKWKATDMQGHLDLEIQEMAATTFIKNERQYVIDRTKPHVPMIKISDSK